ncbi:MAG: hypothetical protein ABIG10_03980 [bacterium]
MFILIKKFGLKKQKNYNIINLPKDGTYVVKRFLTKKVVFMNKRSKDPSSDKLYSKYNVSWTLSKKILKNKQFRVGSVIEIKNGNARIAGFSP